MKKLRIENEDLGKRSFLHSDFSILNSQFFSHTTPMLLTKHATPAGKRWALDGRLLPETFTLKSVLVLKASEIDAYLKSLPVPAAELGTANFHCLS